MILVATLLQALIASFFLIALPLRLWKTKQGFNAASITHYRILLYFFSLGLAFLFIEIAFIQKFILFLHHPLYAITIVLSTFLLSAGIGSHYSGYFSKRSHPIIFPVFAITLLSVLYLLFFEAMVEFLLGQETSKKIIFSILLIAPLGFFMGMPFPLAMEKISHSIPAFIPWAWGINGCASVISAILATLIAIQFGLNFLIFMAIVLYILAGINFPSFLKRQYTLKSFAIANKLITTRPNYHFGPCSASMPYSFPLLQISASGLRGEGISLAFTSSGSFSGLSIAPKAKPQIT